MRSAECGLKPAPACFFVFFVFHSALRISHSALEKMVRLQKFLADAGIASRRAAERIILEGRVSINGDTVSELGRKIDPLHDHVSVDGKRVKARRKIYLALNKPKGLVCSRNDELGRATI